MSDKKNKEEKLKQAAEQLAEIFWQQIFRSLNPPKTKGEDEKPCLNQSENK